MHTAEFTIEAVTPIFMRGANQRKAEIRASSIKGLMRWWFRALAGNYFGNDVVGLRRAEEYVFGSTKRRSKVVVEVESVESNLQIEPESNYERYFWFSQIGRYSKPSILTGHLQITVKSFDVKAIKASLLSLWMAMHLGGFGSRSRKFAGSVFPVKEPGTNFDFNFKFIPKHNLKDYYTQSFKRIISEMNKILESLNFRKGSTNNYPKYPTLSPKTAWVFVGKLVNEPEEAIEEVGKWYLGEFNGRKFISGFRFRHADRKMVHRIYSKYRKGEEIKNISANNERRPYLGLPIQFYKKFSEKHVKFTVNHWNADRRASSIIFTLNKMNNRYYPVISVLKYTFLPNYKGPVKYSGGIFRGGSKIKPVGGALFILKKGEHHMMAYNHFYDELVNDLKSNFEVVFP